MTPDLARKVVVLTGGGDGIGRECGLAYARAGAAVDILDWNMAAAERTTAELCVESLALQADGSDVAAVPSAMTVVLERPPEIQCQIA